ncbi:hypothetical protein ACRAWD_21450 [Caulobacter segnis]
MGGRAERADPQGPPVLLRPLQPAQAGQPRPRPTGSNATRGTDDAPSPGAAS